MLRHNKCSYFPAEPFYHNSWTTRGKWKSNAGLWALEEEVFGS